MSAGKQVGGIKSLTINGDVYPCKGSWTTNLGWEKRTGIVGADGVHGYGVTPQLAFMEGVITKQATFSLVDLLDVKEATIVLVAANSSIILHDAYFADEGNYTTEEGEIAVRFEGTGDIDE